MTMQRYSEGKFSGFGTEHAFGCWVRHRDAARVIDALQESLTKAEEWSGEQCKQNEILRGLINEGSARESTLREELAEIAQATEVKHPSWHVSKSEHEQLRTERDTLRDVLTLFAPDLKTMAILYGAQGQHERSQALNKICELVQP